MTSIVCPSCGKTIKLNDSKCLSCGFDIQTFFSDVDSLYKYGLAHIDNEPLSSYYAFHRASQFGHAPSTYQLGFLLFRKDCIFPSGSALTRKKYFEYCLVQSAQAGYVLAINKLVDLKRVLITTEANDFLLNLEEQADDISSSFSEEELEQQIIIEKAKKDFINLKEVFNNIKKPYNQSAIEICKLYNECKTYADTILYSSDFFEILENAYEEAHKSNN